MNTNISNLIFEVMESTLSTPYMKFHVAMASVTRLLTALGFPDNIAAEIIQGYITRLSKTCDEAYAEMKDQTQEERREQAISSAKSLKESSPDKYQELCDEFGVDDLISHIEEVIK